MGSVQRAMTMAACSSGSKGQGRIIIYSWARVTNGQTPQPIVGAFLFPHRQQGHTHKPWVVFVVRSGTLLECCFDLEHSSVMRGLSGILPSCPRPKSRIQRGTRAVNTKHIVKFNWWSRNETRDCTRTQGSRIREGGVAEVRVLGKILVWEWNAWPRFPSSRLRPRPATPARERT